MKKKIEFICNNELICAEVNPAVTVLDFLREERKLTGTKEGCREGDCGACTVLVGDLNSKAVNYVSTNSCLLPMERLHGKHLVTIEGLNDNNLTILQSEMVKQGGTQCGFCTPGFIISLTNYFLNNSAYNFEGAISFLDGNICRCTGYEGIKRAVKSMIAHSKSSPKSDNHVKALVDAGILPKYFLAIPSRLIKINSKLISAKKRSSPYLISGGTDLYVQKWEEVYESNVDFISSHDSSDKIKINKNHLHIGGGVTIEEFRNSKHVEKYFPQLKENMKLFGSLPIRNRATVAGNIINASPIADMSNIFLALDASVILSNDKTQRELPLKDLFIGYKILNKRKNEVLTELKIKLPPKSYLFNYEKVSRRTYLDIASVNSSILIEHDADKILKSNISAGGVFPFPLLLKRTSDYLKNRTVSNETVKEAATILTSEISPISDARGSAEYKATLMRHLFYGHFIKLFPKSISAEKLFS